MQEFPKELFNRVDTHTILIYNFSIRNCSLLFASKIHKQREGFMTLVTLENAGRILLGGTVFFMLCLAAHWYFKKPPSKNGQKANPLKGLKDEGYLWPK